MVDFTETSSIIGKIDPSDSLVLEDHLSEQVRRYTAPFRVADFDIQSYSQNLLKNLSVPFADQLSGIEESIAALESCLKNGVLEDHEELTKNISVMDNLEASLIDLEMSFGSLVSSTGSNLRQLKELYDDYSNRLDECERMKDAMDLLRKSTRIFQAAKKIRSAFEGISTDWLRISGALLELEGLLADPTMKKLNYLAADFEFIQETSEQFPNVISTALKEAVLKQEMSEIGSIVDALLLSKNSVIKNVTNEFILEVGNLIREALEMNALTQSDAGKTSGKVPGRTTLPSVQTTPALRAAFWGKLESMFDAVYQYQLKIELLESVFLRRYQEFSLYSVDAPEVEDGLISLEFYKDAVSILKKELECCGKKSTFQQQILENEFPRLLKLQKESVARLKNSTLFLDFSESLLHFSRSSISTFQELFVSRSLSRLLDPVNVTFNDPSSENVENILRIIGTELSICGNDEILGTLLCKNIAKTLRLMFVKLEGLVGNDGEATQVIGPLTASQIRNFKLLGLCVQIDDGVKELLKKDSVIIPEEGGRAIQDTLKAHETLIQSIISPLLSSLLDSVEAILLTMRQEDFSVGDEDSEGKPLKILESPCSLYMRELQDFLSRSQSTFFSQLNFQTPVIHTAILRFARRVFELFVRHLMLIRPVNQNGRLKLAADCAQLEFALAPLNLHHSEYGKDLEVLKNIRTMLFQSANEVAENHSLGTIVPFSVVLHLLFSRAPAELQSPYQHLGWSISRYSNYLDEHPMEAERLALISKALDGYAEFIRSRGEEHYSVIYPLMRNILNRGLENLGVSLI